MIQMISLAFGWVVITMMVDDGLGLTQYIIIYYIYSI